MPSYMSPSYRPTRGTRQLGGSSLYFTDGSKIPGARIDARPRAARMMGGPDEGPLATRGNQFLPNRPQTRQANIDAARADGTFDAKRAAYNAANKGSYMDEKGTIGPKAPLPTGNPANERVPVAPTAPSTPASAKPQMMGPPRPATFEGKSRAEWFGAAAKRQGENNAYSNEALAQAKTPEPTQRLDRQKEVSAAPAAVAATPKPAPAPTSQTPAGVPKPTFDDPAAKDRYNNAMASISAQEPKPAPAATPSAAPAPSPSKATWFSNASKSLTQGAQGMMSDRAAKVQKLADLENRAKPGTTKIAEGATAAAKTVGKAINEGIPKVANTITAGMEDTAKAAIAKAKEVTAPARTWLTGDKNAADEAAKLKAQLNPTAPKPYVPTYTGGDNPPMSAAAMPAEDKKKRVAVK